MALPVSRVSSLAELQAALASDEPRRILLTAIEAVRDAPTCLAVIEEKEESGWICINFAEVDRTASFATSLVKLEQDILPKLLRDCRDRTTLRRLRSCGQAILRVRQSASPSGDLFDLAGNFSNCLGRIARQALSTRKREREPYTVTREWILGKARRVHETLASPVNFVPPPLAPAPPPQLPVYIVAKLEDVRTLELVTAGPPHEINLVCIEALRDAPFYFSAITQKASAGWICCKLPQLDQANRFAHRLATLGDVILPRLMDDAENRTKLRALRSSGRGIWKIRRKARGILFEMMGKYSNSLTRTAREALNNKTAYTVSLTWIHDMSAMVEKDRASAINF